MELFRHSSADNWKKKPLERRAAEGRRSSVVDWISGWTADTKVDTTWNTRNEEGCERLTRNGSVCAVEDSKPDEHTQHKDMLISQLKREVKVIMEEAVAKKTMDLNSPYVTSLCVAVDACLMDGLRRRLLGLFGSRSSFALLHSLAKQNATIEKVLSKTLANANSTSISPHLIWIREALHMRLLSTVIEYIASAKNVRRLYDSHALMLDRAKGGMVAALLLGPCAVTFRRMADKTEEATAEELVERGAARSRINGDSVVHSRPPLTITRQGSSLVSSLDLKSPLWEK
ncbi:unnamed protein product [Caenorhabditis bovis]|uniref:RUN domain-containing protein n=1 Tax=Caenorhabditis bovis TaxID=2654633 RepID=A0A8S1EKU5_9PELO|nr:unnamed protein product [Caenorhabditis bovis]